MVHITEKAILEAAEQNTAYDVYSMTAADILCEEGIPYTESGDGFDIEESVIAEAKPNSLIENLFMTDTERAKIEHAKRVKQMQEYKAKQIAIAEAKRKAAAAQDEQSKDDEAIQTIVALHYPWLSGIQASQAVKYIKSGHEDYVDQQFPKPPEEQESH
jgi:hypothetical protein